MPKRKLTYVDALLIIYGVLILFLMKERIPGEIEVRSLDAQYTVESPYFGIVDDHGNKCGYITAGDEGAFISLDSPKGGRMYISAGGAVLSDKNTNIVWSTRRNEPEEANKIP